MGETCSKHGEMRNFTQNFSRKSEEKSRFRRPMRRWQDNIKMYRKNMRCKGVDSSSGSGQTPMTGYCEHCDETSGSIKEGKFLNNLND
jgi:hypothetical protein